jgi:SAM-dependent methyltransferase
MNHNSFLFEDGKFLSDFEKMYRNESAGQYDSWEQDAPSIYKQIDKLLAFEAIGSQSGTILDLGCGKGHFTNLLATRENKIIGVDISLTAIDIAKTRYPSIDFKVDDVEDSVLLSNGAIQDLIVARALLYYLPTWKDVLYKIARRSKYTLLGNHIPPETRLYIKSKDQLYSQIIQSGMEIIEVVEFPAKNSFSLLCKSIVL